MDDDKITEEEFAAWLSPASALIVLDQLSDAAAIRAILSRASNGLILGAAATARWTSGGKPKTAELFSIPSDWWEKSDVAETWHDFWTVGDMVVRLSDVRSSAVHIHLFDVRFDPIGIPAILGGLLARSRPPASALRLAAPRQKPATTDAERAPVTTDDVKAWHRALSKSDKALGIRALWAMAKSDLGSGVVRKQIEPFVAGRTRGPKGPRKG